MSTKAQKAAQEAADRQAAITVELRKAMLAAVKATTANDKAKAGIEKRTEGACTGFTKIAAANTCVDFEGAIDDLFKAIKSNEDGIAETLKCKPNTRKEGAFCIPNSASSAKSTLCAAYGFNTPLLEEDGKPRSFKAIKKDVKESQALAKKEAQTPEQKGRESIAVYLEELAQFIRDQRDSDCDDTVNGSFHKLLSDVKEWETAHAVLVLTEDHEDTDSQDLEEAA